MSLLTEIKVEMVRAGKTVSDLATALNVARPTISKKLNGHTEFTYGEVAKVAEVLNISASELVRRAEETKTTS